MSKGYIAVQKSQPLIGEVCVSGSKNASLPIIASLILTSGKSVLTNIPNSEDIRQMILLLESLGAEVEFDVENSKLTIDTSNISSFKVSHQIMNKMRASILVMGPLLARFGKAVVASPGGCLIGSRPIDFHLRGFRRMGVQTKNIGRFIEATFDEKGSCLNRRITFEYPSVGATENLMMFSCFISGTTTIVNAAIEPEVLDLIYVLRKMGAKIETGPGLQIKIEGVNKLNPIEHDVIPDRLEAGSILLAAAITCGEISIPNAQPEYMDVFLDKLREMGHEVVVGKGIKFKATKYPQAVKFKTCPYPGFPTDLQAPMMAALSLANGISEVEETVFENRLMHVEELKKMGAQIEIKEKNKAIIRGVEELYGCEVIATDIRASCALVLAGLAAQDETKVVGINHWTRGYDRLEKKIGLIGGLLSKFS